MFVNEIRRQALFSAKNSNSILQLHLFVLYNGYFEFTFTIGCYLRMFFCVCALTEVSLHINFLEFSLHMLRREQPICARGQPRPSIEDKTTTLALSESDAVIAQQ